MAQYAKLFALAAFLTLQSLGLPACGQDERAVMDLVIQLLGDEANWDKASAFGEKCDLDARTLSLACALEKAQIEITGKFGKRNPLMRAVRAKIRKHFFFRHGIHPINHFNKHRKTNHGELMFLLNAVREDFEGNPK